MEGSRSCLWVIGNPRFGGTGRLGCGGDMQLRFGDMGHARAGKKGNIVDALTFQRPCLRECGERARKVKAAVGECVVW